MYTRAFFDNGGAVPEGYDGEALREGAQPQSTTIQPQSAEPKISPVGAPYSFGEDICEQNPPQEEGGAISGFFEALGIKRLFKDFTPTVISSISLEDIIIISIAALLLFSEGGDKLLSIMLLALLFIDKGK